jgi:hypothetical protein
VRLRLRSVLSRGEEEADAGGRSHGTVRDDWGLFAFLIIFYRRGERLARRWWWLPGWAFAAVTQLPALLAVAWLLPGTGMLLAGRLLPLPMVIIFVPLAVALCYFAMRRLPMSWPGFADAQAEPALATTPADTVVATGRRGSVPLGALLATVAIAAGFGVWQAVFGSQQVFAVADPSVYLQYGYWIAEHGTARIPESASAFGSASGLVFSSPGYIASGGSITPAFLPGLPLVLAAGTWIAGLGGALLMPAVLGGCAVLSFAGLVGRLAGARWAPAGALVLAVSLPELFVSRAPFSEPLVQVLLFGGLCLFIDSLGIFGGLALAGLGGLALGLTVLASIGSLSMLLPVFPVLALLFVVRRPQSGPFGLGLFLGIGTGLTAGLVLARSYLSTLSSELHLFGLCTVGFCVVTALMAPFGFPGVRDWVRRAFRGRAHLVGLDGKVVSLPSLGSVVQWLAFALPVLALVGLAIRPYLQTVRGQTDPTLIRAVASLQRIARLPVDGRRQYYEQSLDWVLWYLGVPAILLACAGGAVLGRRSVRVMLEWRSSAEGWSSVLAARLWGLPFLMIAWSVVTVLWDPAVAPWQPWASHRLVPVVLPGLVLLGVWVSSRLTARALVLGASRWTVVLVGVCCVLALVIPPVFTSLNPGLAARPSVGRHSSGLAKLVSRVRLRGVGASSVYGGSVAAASALCASIGPSASVVFVSASTAAEFAPVVRDLCGQPAASVAAVPSASSAAATSAASAAAIEQVVTSIERAGRQPVLLGPSRSGLSLFGVVPRQVISLRTSQDPEVLTGPPAGPWPVSYTLWMASPLAGGAS